MPSVSASQTPQGTPDGEADLAAKAGLSVPTVRLLGSPRLLVQRLGSAGQMIGGFCLPNHHRSKKTGDSHHAEAKASLGAWRAALSFGLIHRAPAADEDNDRRRPAQPPGQEAGGPVGVKPCIGLTGINGSAWQPWSCQTSVVTGEKRRASRSPCPPGCRSRCEDRGGTGGLSGWLLLPRAA
jgi:hypothetical protein